MQINLNPPSNISKTALSPTVLLETNTAELAISEVLHPKLIEEVWHCPWTDCCADIL
jgi:hypothetical protein